MKIIIVGAGRVGESIADNLLSENYEITLIDQNGERLQELQDRLDLRGVQGNAANIDVLEEAGVAEADILISCASLEETNLVVCKLAKMLFNTPTVIARVRSSHMEHQEILTSKEGFAVDMLLCPEISLTNYITKLVDYPQALQVRNFAGGLVSLISVRARFGSPLVRHTISEISQIMPDVAMRVVAIYRRLWDGPDQLMMTDGNTRIEPDDEVFVLAEKKHLPAILDGFHQLPTSIFKNEDDFKSEQFIQEEEQYNHEKKALRIIIAGGGRVGYLLAQELFKDSVDHNLKIIERDHDRCIYLASKLDDSILVLHGNVTDEELLSAENIASVDLFLSVTNDDEDNIMSALLAKRYGAKRALALINRRSYADLMHSTQIDIALAPVQAMLGELLTHLRRGEVRAVHSLRRGVAEALEIVAQGTPQTSKVIGHSIEDLKLPAGVKAGLIIRGLPDTSTSSEADQERAVTHEPEILVARSNTVIQANDHVILFLPSKRLIHDVEKLFHVGSPSLF